MRIQSTSLGVLLFLVVTVTQAADRVALVIGNGAYQHTSMLANPARDADGIAGVLRRLGFEVTQGKDLTRVQMEALVTAFSRSAANADIALVYYAGHGLESSGRNYLVPVDAQLPDQLALRTEAVEMDFLLEAMGSARTRLLFLDACRNNPLANQMRSNNGGRLVARGLARVSEGAYSNTLIAFATQPGNVAEDGSGQNSPFAAALMDNLVSPGLDIQQVLRKVRRQVVSMTQKRQTPWESSQLFDDVVLVAGAVPPAPVDFSTFRDCADCPEMIRIPGGSFRMGDLSGNGFEEEKPVHTVNIKLFAVGKFEVTFDEWDACVASGGCHYRPDDKGWGRATRPVINVSWDDTQAYLSWLSRKTGKTYRLLSESEWEYVARAGTTTEFSTGNCLSTTQANFDGKHNFKNCGKSDVSLAKTQPVGSYGANPWGLHDVHGNVWEWTMDCWNGNYVNAPADGSAWLTGNCDRRMLRGGSWDDLPAGALSYSRYGNLPYRDFNVGFRIARTL